MKTYYAYLFYLLFYFNTENMALDLQLREQPRRRKMGFVYLICNVLKTAGQALLVQARRHLKQQSPLADDRLRAGSGPD